MVIVLRHDVDNPIWNSIALNYIFLRIKGKTIREKDYIPHYLEDVKVLLNFEKAHEIKATWFFRTCTLPSEDKRNELLSLKHEIAYHSDRDEEYETFLHDLTILKNSIGEVKGVSHHGSKPYNEKKLLKYIGKAGLCYLGQGVQRESWLKPQKIDNVWVFGNHVTLKQIAANYDYTTGEKIIFNYIRDKKVAQILLHPKQYMHSKKIRKLFTNLINKKPKNCFFTHIEAINLILEDSSNSSESR